jgi:hypothetical protein
LPFVTVNAEQAADWNGASGREFIEQRDRHERMLSGLTARLLVGAWIQDGDKVLDVGCGCGDDDRAFTLTGRRASSSRWCRASPPRLWIGEEDGSAHVPDHGYPLPGRS